MDGLDISSTTKIVGQMVLGQLRDQLNSYLDGPRPDPQKWTPGGQSPFGGDAKANPVPAPGVLPNFELQNSTQSQIQLSPEQMVGTGRADDKTKQEVIREVDDARKLGNRSTAAGEYMQAINTANSTHDASLQALAKVEYGLTNMSWGYTSQGFKWLCEAGSNNPSLYNPQGNQSFLQRLGQAGLPQAAVDLLLQNGKNDPNWYLKDASSLKALEQAMTGPAYVAPVGAGDQSGRAANPLAPPANQAPEQAINPNIGQPTQASAWFKDQINGALDSAVHNKDHQVAWGYYKQATDMADRCGDKMLQSVTRVKTGLALISWGAPDDGFQWLLDAGSKNPGMYADQSFQQFLHSSGLTGAAFDMYIGNGRQNANWYTGNIIASAHSLTEALHRPSALNPPAERPVAPTPAPLAPRPSDFPVQNIPQISPADSGLAPHIERNPFAR